MSLHLVRHGSAGKRGFGPSDLERPLDSKGRAQAASLARHLGGAEVAAVYSSPAVRCIQTVQPLAEAHGLSVVVHDELGEGTGGHVLVSTLRRLAGAGVSAVLCSHGDLIPAAVGELAATGIPMAGTGCAKGSIWSLQVVDGRITEGRYIGVPD